MFQPCEWVRVSVVAGWYWSGLVIAGSGDVGGVAVPVGSCLVHPADGGAGAEVQAVSKDGGGQLGGEVDEGGPASGHGPDAEGAQALAGAAQRWFKRLRRTDDPSRLVRAATGTSVDLTQAAKRQARE